MSLSKPVQYLRKGEDILAFTVLILLTIFPIIEIIARSLFNSGVHGSSRYIQHLVVWVTFTGGMITSREERHLSLSAGFDALPVAVKRIIGIVVQFISVSVVTTLAWTSISFVLLGFDPSDLVGIIPIRLATIVIPIGYAVIVVRLIFESKIDAKYRWIPALGVLIGTFLAINSVINILFFVVDDLGEFFWKLSDFAYSLASAAKLPMIILLLVAAGFGAPIFIILGGLAIVFFSASGGSFEIIPNEAYSMLISPTMPAIPLFTLAGFILSESKAGERLVGLFRSFFGWLPGGMAIAAVVVCAFFTTFTGASGVTILALGALLSFVLIQNGNKERFTHGLLTGSGSIGLLFPPSLPIILYGVTAQTNIKHMFLGGIVPGLVMVVALSAMGVFSAIRNKIKPTSFSVKEALVSCRIAIGEILLPIIILLGYFLGIMTLVEAAAVAVLYVIVLEVFIHRDLKPKQLLETTLKAVPVIGGVFIILTVARGFSYYLVDAEIPMQLSAWVEAHISSKYVFLILLNLVLLITGCLMDIYSAIIVVVPLIIPLGAIFGIHPVHLGIIFLANLELGYLTPPVGLNLFLASYRFNKPLGTVYKDVIPFFLVLLVTVFLITYVPWFSTALLPG